MVGEWSLRPLGELTENFDSIRVPVKGTDRRSGPYPYYGASGIVDYVEGFLFDGEYLLIAEDGENLRTRTTPIAFLARGKFWVNNHAHIVRGNSEADTRFLMYALANADVAGYLTGSAFPKLTQANLNRIHVPAPSLLEQRAIASILSALDDKIDLNQRMNETLEDIARALFKSWFVDFDPVYAKEEGRSPAILSPLNDLFPDSFDIVESREIPRGWKMRAIAELATVSGGSTPSTKEETYWKDGIHCWTTPKDLSNVRTPVLLDTDRKITNAGLAQVASGLLPLGTVLMSSRAPIGYLAIAEVPVAINQGFIAMRATAGISNLFLMRWAEWAHDLIVSRANGSTFLEISKSNFRPIPVITPPDNLMNAFDRAVRPLYSRVVANERSSRTLAQLRDALSPRLVSGELRIREVDRILGSLP